LLFKAIHFLEVILSYQPSEKIYHWKEIIEAIAKSLQDYLHLIYSKPQVVLMFLLFILTWLKFHQGPYQMLLYLPRY
jgi:hypothetical protein